VTPEGRAFFAGTYWPPEPVQGHPAFRQVLDAVLDAWVNRREEVERNGAAIVEVLAQGHPVAGELPTDFAPVIAMLEGFEDATFGGFGDAPKFPVAPVLRFLVERRAPLADRTLDAMAASPLRDPVDGGFFRYSTKRDWHDPHYERMLYDNAQLVAVYALAGRADIAEGVAHWLTTMQLQSGGFASAQDSESTVDGRRVEGFYYTLDAASRKRVEMPPVDEKILTGWNGLAIEGLSIAGTVLGRPEWVAAAQRAADFLLEHHVTGRLIRTSIGGVLSSAHATLEDFGMLAGGLLQLAIATGEPRYAIAARTLVDDSLAAPGEPFGVPGGADPVLASQGLAVEADPSDGAHPSGLSAMASAAYTLFLLTAHEPYRAAARAAMARVAEAAQRHPVSLGAALTVMARLAEPVLQLVVVVVDRGEGADGGRAAAARGRRGGVSVVVTADQSRAWAAAGFELFEGRTARAAYVCEDFVCRLPVTSATELARLLA
jgi:hypothetical protein